jgi:hypothetical protein
VLLRGETHLLRGFLYGMVFENLELECLPYRRSQCANALLKLCFIFESHIQRLWGRPGVGDAHHLPACCRVAVVVDGELWGSGPFAENHERRVDGDTSQPSQHAGATVEAVQVDVGSQEGILQSIFGVFAIPGDPFGNPKNLF